MHKVQRVVQTFHGSTFIEKKQETVTMIEEIDLYSIEPKFEFLGIVLTKKNLPAIVSLYDIFLSQWREL